MAAERDHSGTAINATTPLPVSFLVPLKGTFSSGPISVTARWTIEDARRRNACVPQLASQKESSDVLLQPESPEPAAVYESCKTVTSSPPRSIYTGASSHSSNTSFTTRCAPPGLNIGILESGKSGTSGSLSNGDDSYSGPGTSTPVQEISVERSADPGSKTNVDDLLLALTEPYLMEWCQQ